MELHSITRRSIAVRFCVVLLVPVLGLSAGCGAARSRTEQATADSYLAAAEASDLEGLRALMAYQPEGDPTTLVLGSRIPLSCVRIEERSLQQFPVDSSAPPRLTQVHPPVPHNGSAAVDIAYFRLRNGDEVGRQLLQVDGTWYVLAEANNVCNALF